MSREVVIMYVVAAAFVALGGWQLLGLRRPRSEPSRYRRLMIGVMAIALGAILAIFATAQWSWSVAT